MRFCEKCIEKKHHISYAKETASLGAKLIIEKDRRCECECHEKEHY